MHYNRVKHAVAETANISYLTVLLTATLLTFDWALLVSGAALEVVYLFWALSPQYQGRLHARSGKRSVTFLDRVLLVVTVGGFVSILFFGFGKHLLNNKLPHLTHAQGWEFGAIVWTSLFLFYYLAKFRVFHDFGRNAVTILIVALVNCVLLVTAWLTMAKPVPHVSSIMGIGICFSILDGLSMRFNNSDKEKMLSKASFWWADVPMVVAVFILLLYLLLHRDTENSDVFVSGVIACQLLISNVVFVVMEFGFIRPAVQDEGIDVLVHASENKLCSAPAALALSRKGKLLACCRACDIQVFFTRFQKWQVTANAEVCALAFSPNGKTLASAGVRPQVTLWKLRDPGKPDMLDADESVSGTTDDVFLCLEFSSAGRLLAAGTRSGAVRLWDLKKGSRRSLLLEMKSEVRALAFFKDGSWLVSGGKGKILLWNTAALTQEDLEQKALPIPGDETFVTSLAVAKDGKLLAAGTEGGKIWLWRRADGKTDFELTGSPLLWHAGPVQALRFSPRASLLASAATDGVVLWKTKTGESRPVRGERWNSPSVIAFARTQWILAGASSDGTLKVWHGR